MQRVMTVAGQAFTRTGSLYSVGVASIVPFALVSLAVTTRYLGPRTMGGSRSCSRSRRS